jgi:restriction system protein
MPAKARTWLVRAGRDAAFIEDFRTNSLVAIGWSAVGPIDPGVDEATLRRRFDEAYPQEKPEARRVWQAQVRRFLADVQVGDAVATYDPNGREYLLGSIAGPAAWRDAELPRWRRVNWTHRASRDLLSANTRNGLGSIATLFRPSQEASDELWTKATPLGVAAALAPPLQAPSAAAAEPTAADEQVREDVIEKAAQFIEDRIAALDWKQMQELVAGILRAMGYIATVSAEGSDRGVDVFASPDGLGLQEPRIFVEVKHRSGPMGADILRSFLGGRRAGDRCLYVSTGGFTKEARYEADRANVPLTLITLPKLRELLLQHYERMDPTSRALVPLQRLYWPVD